MTRLEKCFRVCYALIMAFLGYGLATGLMGRTFLFSTSQTVVLLLLLGVLFPLRNVIASFIDSHQKVFSKFPGILTWGILLFFYLPIILLVICLGLGMDYDILLTTRIKENVRGHGMSNDDAIRHAVTHTGSVITICGLIMGGAFGTLMISGMTLLQEFGFALCFAILVDALTVRTYIVPAIMHLLGDWNWKGPGVKLEKKQ